MSMGKSQKKNTVHETRPHSCEPPAGLPPLKMHVTWDREKRTNATNSRGVTIPMAAAGGALSENVPSALEVFVASLGGCPIHEILTIMNAKEQVVKDLEADITGTRRMTPPTLFDTLHVTFTLTGDIDDAFAGEVIRDVMTRRCPVAVSFGRASYLTWEHRIIPCRRF